MLEIKENILLAPYTTFKIGGPARYFCEVRNEEELKEALEWVRQKNLPYFILGGGSNLLVSDDGFSGLVIKIQVSSFKIQDFVIECGAGAPLAKAVSEAANAGLSGLEWAVGIPGTVGGGVCGNCGAYGHSISESVIGGRAINSRGEIINFDKNFCDFRYRGSRFAKDGPLFYKGPSFAIIEVKLKLAKGEADKIKEGVKKIIRERAGKIPPFPSAGSFFKNYLVQEKNDPLLEMFPELMEKTKGGKIAAGYLIEQCGLKGKTIGGAKISEQHANFLVNAGGATANDISELARLCKEKVKEKFGIEIEEEIKRLGF